MNSALADLIRNSGPDALFVDGDWVESKDQDPEGGVRLTQLADVGVGAWLNKSARFMTDEKARQLRCTFLKPGDILIARMPDPLGRACIFPGDKMPCVTVVDVCIARLGDMVERRWLVHQLNGPAFRRQLGGFINGTTRQRVSRTNLGQLIVDVPPLSEQRRIADILDKADAVRRKRKEAIALTEELLRSAFLEMLGDPVMNPKGWPTRKLGDVFDIARGGSPRPIDDFISDAPDAIPWISIRDASKSSKFITETRLKIRREGIPRSRIVNPGDFLLTNSMSFGRPYICRMTGCIHDGWLVLAPREPRCVNQDYFFQVLGSEFVYRQFAKLAAGAVVKNLNIQLVEGVTVPVPSPKAQRDFGRFAQSIDAVKAREAQALADADTLFGSLVQRAFRGELHAPTAKRRRETIQ